MSAIKEIHITECCEASIFFKEAGKGLWCTHCGEEVYNTIIFFSDKEYHNFYTKKHIKIILNKNMLPKFTFPDNKATKIKLLYDQPLRRDGQYGEYHIYTAIINEKKQVFFANRKIHDLLRHCKSTDDIELTKVPVWSPTGHKIDRDDYKLKLNGKDVDNFKLDLEEYKQSITN